MPFLRFVKGLTGAANAGKSNSKIKRVKDKIKKASQARSALDSDETEKKTLNPTLLFVIPSIAVPIIIFLLMAIIVTFFFQIGSHSVELTKAFGADMSSTGSSSTSTSTLDASEFDSLFYPQCLAPYSGVTFDAAGNDICSGGCGLCSITHAIDILTGQNFTPVDINNQLQSFYSNVNEYAPNGSIVGKLVEFAAAKYSLTYNHYYNIDDALNDMKNGTKVIICSDNGSGPHFVSVNGGMYTANHVIMCYKTDGENCWVKDPGQNAGNSVKYTKEQLGQIAFAGFYVIGK